MKFFIKDEHWHLIFKLLCFYTGNKILLFNWFFVLQVYYVFLYNILINFVNIFIERNEYRMYNTANIKNAVSKINIFLLAFFATNEAC